MMIVRLCLTKRPHRGLAYVSPHLQHGQGGNRTPDTRIFSPLLYQLSYLAGRGNLSSLTTLRTPYNSPDPITPT